MSADDSMFFDSMIEEDDDDGYYVSDGQQSIDMVTSAYQCIQLIETPSNLLDRTLKRISEGGKVHTLEFETDIHHLKVLQHVWLDSLLNVISNHSDELLDVLEALQYSHEAIQYLWKLKQLVTIQRGAAKEPHVCKVKLLSEETLEAWTLLVCTTLIKLRQWNKLSLLDVVLNIFLDSLELLMSSLLEGVAVPPSVVQDWCFLLTLPWFYGQAAKMPSCTAVSKLNQWEKLRLKLDKATKNRCISAFRFEQFYPFRSSVKVIMNDCFKSTVFECADGVLSLIRGMHWPALMFDWKTIILYISNLVFDQSFEGQPSPALAEAVSTLPCLFFHRVKSKSRSDVQEFPSTLACPRCDSYERSYTLNTRSEIASCSRVKLSSEDLTVLQILLKRLLATENTIIHVKVLRILRGLRNHSSLNAAGFIQLYLWVSGSVAPVSSSYLVTYLGLSTRDRERILSKSTIPIEDLRSSCTLTSVSQQSPSNMDTVEYPTSPVLATRTISQECRESASKRKGQSGTVKPNYKRPRLHESENALTLKCILITSQSYKSPSLKDSQVQDDPSPGYSSQKEIMMLSKAAPLCPPAIGRFDSSICLYSTLLSRFYLETFDQNVHHWKTLLEYHNMLWKLSMYSDGEVWTAEILKCYLHILSRLKTRFAITLGQITFRLLAARAGCSSEELLGRYRETLANEIRSVCLGYFQNQEQSSDECCQFFRRICAAAEMQTRQMKEILLRLVLKRCIIRMFQDHRNQKIVSAVSRFCYGGPLSNFLQTEFAYYCPYVMIHSANERCLDDFFRNLTKSHGFDPAVACRLNSLWVHVEMISQMCDHKAKVIENYERVVKWHDEENKLEGAKLHRKISETINTKSFGVLIAFHQRFQSRSESIASKRKYLMCLTMLLGIMGKTRVNQSKFKIYATLIELIDLGPQHYDVLRIAWIVFLKHLEGDSLGQICYHILAAMYPLIPEDKSDIQEVVNRIITASSSVRDNIHKFYCLEDFCADESTVETVLSLAETARQSAKITLFESLAEDIGHENAFIRQLAAKKMKSLLQADFIKIEEVNYDNQIFSSTVTKLMRNLLIASKDACEEMQETCASCLGMIGALDPRRFDLKEQLDPNERLGMTIFTVGEADFITFVVEELSRILQSSDDAMNFDDCAYCIQELMKFYGVTNDPQNEIWCRLSLKAKDIIDPLRTSKYNYKPNDIDVDSLSHPLFLSEHGMQFTKWMYHWMLRLISMVRTPEIKNFFNIAKVVAQRNSHAGLMLLPYVASYAVMEGNNAERKVIFEEVNNVLLNWIGPSRPVEMHAPGFKSKLGSNEEYEVPMSSINPDALSCNSSKEAPLCDDTLQLPFCATQAIFKILDHFDRLVRNPKVVKPKKTSAPTASQRTEEMKAARRITPEDAKPIKDLQSTMHYDRLAVSAFECYNFARALMYLEQHIKETSRENIYDCLSLLQRIYIAMYDEDSVKGVVARKQDVEHLMDEISNKLCQGQIEKAIPDIEVSLEEEGGLQNYQQMIYAHLALSRHDMARLIVNGAQKQSPYWSRAFDEANLEISLKGSNPGELRAYTNKLCSDKLYSWGVSVADTFHKFRRPDFEGAANTLRSAKVELINKVSSGVPVLDMGYYFRHYKDLIRFQLLSELEEAITFTHKETTLICDFDALEKTWEHRLKCVHSSADILRTIVSFRKTVLESVSRHHRSYTSTGPFSVIQESIKNSCLALADIEVQNGNESRANRFMLELAKHNDPYFFYNKAKMLNDIGKMEECLKVIERGVQENTGKIHNFLRASVKGVSKEREILSSAALLLAQQMDLQKKADFSHNVRNYNLAVELNSASEENYFQLANYYDKVWCSIATEDRHQSRDSQKNIVKNYSLSLEHGCNHVYQSLPRLLTIWFDLAGQEAKSASINLKDVMRSINEYIKRLVDRCPTYIFMIAYNQLISRLTHSSASISNQLCDILTHMVVRYPQQMLWMMVNVQQSKNPARSNKCTEILHAAIRKKKSLEQAVKIRKTFCEYLVQFTMKPCDKVTYVNLSEIFPTLPRLMKSDKFGQVLVPFQEFMLPKLPRGGKYLDNYEPFSRNPVYIHGISEKVQLMNSLQKPKRISIIGSNGKSYGLLCKPSDDLRKDGKVMEINNMVQWYMNRDNACSKRNLVIRRYYVTPLSDTCGLIEWIPNLYPFRPLILNLYKDGYSRKDQPKRLQICDKRDDLKKKRKVFEDLYLPEHPPVLSYWFLKIFPEPQSWYAARTSYVRTAAVMSIIGYLMGLGDRHGENILLDASNGDVVHVDFNCLFNKGETFEFPERVPFRLTQNMIDGMGPLRYEGPFRCCCEIVMKLLRHHYHEIMSIMRPFVDDPLVEWNSSSSSSGRSTSGAETNSKEAIEVLNNIQNRLKGTARNFKKGLDVPLSVEAQVNHLINEATSIENLCQMYIGWAAYL